MGRPDLPAAKGKVSGDMGEGGTGRGKAQWCINGWGISKSGPGRVQVWWHW